MDVASLQEEVAAAIRRAFLEQWIEGRWAKGTITQNEVRIEGSISLPLLARAALQATLPAVLAEMRAPTDEMMTAAMSKLDARLHADIATAYQDMMSASPLAAAARDVRRLEG